MDDNTLKDLAKSTKALLLMQLQAQGQPEQPDKPEILLARAGFGSREIADMLGKKQTAVLKTLQRAGRAA